MGLTTQVADSGLLLATKLKAYLHRGGGDVVMSHDIADVVTLVES